MKTKKLSKLNTVAIDNKVLAAKSYMGGTCLPTSPAPKTQNTNGATTLDPIDCPKPIYI